MSQPVFLVTVDDARAHGRATAPGGAWDFPCAPAEHKADDPPRPSPWVHCGTEYVPALHSIGPLGAVPAFDMNLADWNVDPFNLNWSDTAIPAGGSTKFLSFYDGRPNAIGRVTTVVDVPPAWGARVIRYATPAGSELPHTDWSIKMIGAGLGYPSWRIVFPSNGAPYLLFDRYSNGHAERVSTYPADSSNGEQQSYTDYWIKCEQDLNLWNINLAVNGVWGKEPWVYTPPGCDIGNPHLHDAATNETPICSWGPIQVQSQGQPLMFSLCPLEYQIISETYWREPWQVDNRYGDVMRTDDSHITADAQIVGPEGGGAYVEIDSLSDTVGEQTTQRITPRVVFNSVVGQRPLCGYVGVSLPALIGDVTTAPWSSSAYKFHPDDKLSYTRRSTWQANEFHATLRDPAGTLDWQGNEVVKFELNYGTPPAAPILNTIFTGHLVGPVREKDGVKSLQVQLDAMDFAGLRMKAKAPIAMRSLGGLDFELAFRECGNRMGFSDDRIIVTDCAGLWLPTTQILGDPSYAYGPEAKWEEILNGICLAVGRRWGINEDGRLFAKPPYADTGEPYVFTFSSNSVTPEEWVGNFSTKRDMEEFANNTYVITGEDGYREFGWARDAGSEATPTDKAFVGDNFQHVEKLERQLANAQTLADASLVRRLRFNHSIVWTPLAAHPDIMPGSYIKTQIENAQVPANAIFFVTEEQGAINPGVHSASGWQQTFTMVRVS